MFVTYMYVLYTTNILIYTLCPMFLSFIRIIIMYYYYFNLRLLCFFRFYISITIMHFVLLLIYIFILLHTQICYK